MNILLLKIRLNPKSVIKKSLYVLYKLIYDVEHISMQLETT